jgi:deoxyribodipyrimidine photo-lyase
MPRVPRYATARNYVRAGYDDLSRLSHWIRYRVITEEECVAAVLESHSAKTAEKFLQELLWRTYWKGWLELRPSVWESYLSDVGALSKTYENSELYRRAMEGATDLTFFNDWVVELTSTGYLHNHTRMWFASVWIFTLNLPWQLGARFMYHHLLDADPASNTLSWRWVAGLQTPGKIYMAQPRNISTYSDGRWNPEESELCSHSVPPHFEAAPPPGELTAVTNETLEPRSLILLHDDDLSADLSGELKTPGAHYAVFAPPPHESSAEKATFISSLRNDTAERVSAELVTSAEEIAASTSKLGVTRVHMMSPRVGFERDTIITLAAQLDELGVSVVWYRRGWDEQFMPLARRGFFPFWEHVKGSFAP